MKKQRFGRIFAFIFGKIHKKQLIRKTPETGVFTAFCNQSEDFFFFPKSMLRNITMSQGKCIYSVKGTFFYPDALFSFLPVPW
ncbi:MAG: hypothetical protein Q4C58_06035 [Eubacteriales bacterium]|nr:hypothetical protein [Eubacteriales bacterium]